MSAPRPTPIAGPPPRGPVRGPAAAAARKLNIPEKVALKEWDDEAAKRAPAGAECGGDADCWNELLTRDQGQLQPPPVRLMALLNGVVYDDPSPVLADLLPQLRAPEDWVGAALGAAQAGRYPLTPLEAGFYDQLGAKLRRLPAHFAALVFFAVASVHARGRVPRYMRIYVKALLDERRPFVHRMKAAAQRLDLGVPPGDARLARAAHEIMLAVIAHLPAGEGPAQRLIVPAETAWVKAADRATRQAHAEAHADSGRDPGAPPPLTATDSDKLDRWDLQRPARAECGYEPACWAGLRRRLGEVAPMQARRLQENLDYLVWADGVTAVDFERLEKVPWIHELLHRMLLQRGEPGPEDAAHYVRLDAGLRRLPAHVLALLFYATGSFETLGRLPADPRAYLAGLFDGRHSFVGRLRRATAALTVPADATETQDAQYALLVAAARYGDAAGAGGGWQGLRTPPAEAWAEAKRTAAAVRKTARKVEPRRARTAYPSVLAAWDAQPRPADSQRCGDQLSCWEARGRHAESMRARIREVYDEIVRVTKGKSKLYPARFARVTWISSILDKLQHAQHGVTQGEARLYGALQESLQMLPTHVLALLFFRVYDILETNAVPTNVDDLVDQLFDVTRTFQDRIIGPYEFNYRATPKEAQRAAHVLLAQAALSAAPGDGSFAGLTVPSEGERRRATARVDAELATPDAPPRGRLARFVRFAPMFGT